MMNPNMSPMFRGSKLVPSKRPREAIVTQDRGTTVTMIHQWKLRWASTPLACTTEAMGRTMMAEIRPWTAPDSTLPMAPNQTGQGAEGGLAPRPTAAADALADLGEHVEEDEAQQEGLHQHPDDELDEMLAH